jgi:hypothetical protein
MSVLGSIERQVQFVILLLEISAVAVTLTPLPSASFLTATGSPWDNL